MKGGIALIVRPPAEGSKLEGLMAEVSALRVAGCRIAVRLTRGRGHGRRLAQSAAQAGWDVVAAAGGDGTINEVVNGLVEADTGAALAVVPLGTANDFANGLGIPEDIGDALRVAWQGRRRCVDVARVNRRCFVNVSTGGFGADISQSMGRVLKKHAGGFAYVLRGAQQLVEFPIYEAGFHVDGEVVHDGGFVFFAVGNARQTGGGTQVAPLADVGDGCLDVVLVREMTRREFIAMLPRLRLGTHLDSPHVSYYRAANFSVHPRGHIPVNADGEAVSGQMFRYDLMERRQAVLVPSPPDAEPDVCYGSSDHDSARRNGRP